MSTSSTDRPEQIGPYHILDVLGEGGMGTVYLAEQKEPVRRRVALKLIKLGMDSKSVLARFGLERQALAVMNHDAIAKVFDAGTTESGQPFFVMELVEGEPLTGYADRHKLSLPERIGLFQQLCAGVQHAHQKGVIHRDLKPGNVLVARKGKDHVLKIIDFGVARATDHQLVQQTIFTEQGTLVGTWEYMSPEQAAGDALQIDTRTDVYSLGVMLYDLLCGTLPFPSEELRRAGLLEIQRKLRDDEPPKPSTRVSTQGVQASEPAVRRRTTAVALGRALRRDLDWIVLMAMAKEPERRYGSPAELAADLGRYLAHEPSVAGPPTVRYRLRKFVQRYRAQVVAGVLVFVTLVGGVIGTLVGFAGEQRQRLAAERQRGVAQHNAGLLADKVREFDQLAAVVHLETALRNEKKLYPAWPAKIPAMEQWLRDDAGRLLRMQPEIERTVQDLEKRARAQTEEEKRQDREAHARFAELKRLEQRVASLRRAQAVRDGRPAIAFSALPDAPSEATGKALNELAWNRVDPDAGKRKVYGEEPFGLACAEAGLARVAGGDASVDKHAMLDTLAWALFAVGRDDAAKARSAEALAAAPERETDAYRGYVEKLTLAISESATSLTRAVAELTALENDIAKRRTWQFTDESQGFLHDTLADVLAKIAAFAANQKPAVEARLLWAKTIRALSIEAHQAKWDEARAEIAKADGVTASGLYRSDPPFELTAQLGLVLIGMNPKTKLWEFYELRSATPGKPVPTLADYDADGRLPADGDTGIVFVLIPGGTFAMGAQKDDEDGPNYHPNAQSDESPHPVTLLPFFLARHELTKGQWQRLSGGGEPSWCRIGAKFEGNPEAIGYAHPVEQVDWSMCDELLRHTGLELPTEAQWEYACRAGTATPWSAGAEPVSLAGFANILDRTGSRTVPGWGQGETFDDGFTGIAPVGRFHANAFGLFDMHGNVWEWCRDWYGPYSLRAGPGDGLRTVAEGSSADRVYRGGSFNIPAANARSAFRSRLAPSFRSFNLGARPARASRLPD